MRRTTPWMFLAVLLVLTAFVPAVARAQTFPARPANGVYVVDQAGLLTADDTAAINTRLDTLLREKRIAAYVVTINNVQQYSGGTTVDTYARYLFDYWGIGFKDYNYGVLLLVSSGDRRARIELGADWGRSYDPFCRDIMDGLIVPRFKAGRFSEGIVSGVEGLDAMARGRTIPSRGFTEGFWDKVNAWSGSSGFWRTVWYGFIVIAAIISSIHSRVKTGRWFNDTDSSDSGDGDGGSSDWGGGGFGDGFSGGGGASGEW